jgi:hypothetical protein
MPAIELTTLLSELTRRGIHLEADGSRLRYYPRSAVTRDLVERMRAHKDELLAALRSKADTSSIDRTDPTAVWHAALDLLEGAPLFPTDVIEALRTAHAKWVGDNEARDPKMPWR